ncbi:MAG: S8 family serine peptidase [Planctomycetota bacterium]|nr:S8 family serine peptidase [Planctomycetota bacterium]
MIAPLSRNSILTLALGAALTAQGEATAPSSQILIRYGSFDPIQSVPSVSEALQTANEGHLWIVQFTSTPTQRDRDAIAALGGERIGYLPKDAYVFRMDAAAAASARQVETVRWVGSYEVAYRIDPVLLERGAHLRGASARYNIVVANKHSDKPTLAAKIARIGGRVEDLHAGSVLIDATLTGPQLLQVAGFDEVLWVDLWSAPEEDMDNARIQGGGDYIEGQAGYTGTGVNLHIYEGIEATHPDFTGGAQNVQSGGGAEDHGHCTAGIVFGNGTSNPAVRGMAPDAGKFYTNYNSASVSRWQVFDDLANIHSVSLSTASWGDSLTTQYNSVSMESDDIVFDHDITWTQSQSNSGNRSSRPQAWAKNLLSVGAVNHGDDADPTNDSWAAGNASIGPASDGRFKPTLCAYYDDIGTSDLTGSAGFASGNWTSGFGGTSGATPIVAGHCGLAIQMFTDESGTSGFGKFGNALRAPGGSVFDNRPHAPTLKALMITTAAQYSFDASSTDNLREHQGWGFPDLKELWDRRDVTFIVDEESVLTQGEADTYKVTVAAGEPSLKICLNWSEPGANPTASQQAINDLSIRVAAPDGTLYIGNVGLDEEMWSVAGNDNFDTVNTIENVFVENPIAGDWFIEVVATAVVEDNHVETPAIDCDYALVVVGGVGQAAPGGVFADLEKIGFGCDGNTCVDAIYEYPTFSMANNSLTLDYENGDYTLVAGQGTWIPPAGSNLGLADNQEVIRNVGFTLPYPGGSTGTIRICSNGWITDGIFTGGSNILPDPSLFLNHTMWAPMWRDLNPAAGGSVWYDVTAQRCVISWISVPNFFNNGSSTFQVQFWNNGDVHYIYQNVTVQGDYLVGFSQGGLPDPGSITLSANLNGGLGICSTSQPEMDLDGSGRPVLGMPLDLVTTNIPFTGLFGTMILSTTPLTPAVDLTFLGLTGCELYQSIDLGLFFGGFGTATLPFPMPSNPALAGTEVFCQAAYLVPAINPLELVVSNGLKLTVGIY